MSDATARLGLPFLLPAQAQKHVTHNEALERLDILVQAVVQAVDAALPPALPLEGETWATSAAPGGDWDGHPLALASWRGDGWVYLPLQAGWRVWVAGLDAARVFDGSAWRSAVTEADLQDLPRLGINASADSVNRLSVAAPATLLSHDGADHQLKINKAAAADTASLLFQTGFSGRAELGLTGSDSFSLRTSGDGTSFVTALTASAAGLIQTPVGLQGADGSAANPGIGFAADPDTGLSRPGANQIGLSAGGVTRAVLSTGALQLDVPLTGTAVQASASDISVPGRLVRTDGALAATLGSFGGYHAASANRNIDTVAAGDAGLYSTANPGTFPPNAGFYWIATQKLYSGEASLQRAVRYTSSGIPQDQSIWWRVRSNNAEGWGPWQRVYSQASILGAVSQSGGVPTGAVIERGSNANGDYVRLADGTQICTRSMAASSGAPATWTFPATFAAAPVITGTAQAAVLSAVCLDAAPTTTAATFSARDRTDARRADTVHLAATGRWF